VKFSVPVLLFARYADEFGPSVNVTLTEPATARDVLAAVRALPGADRLPPAPMVAVNHRYAAAMDAVRPGDEVAIVPPVAGG
jgi:molybdopterin converting factor small subunit